MAGIFRFTENQVLKRIVKFFFANIGKRNSDNRNYNAVSFKENQIFTLQLNNAEARNEFAGFVTWSCSDGWMSSFNYLFAFA